MDRSKEYLMLREEILHLDKITSDTINYSYAFVAAILSFAFTCNDSLVALLPYIVIIPSYKIVLSRSQSIYKITAYLLVFHEEGYSEFNWERRRDVFVNKVGGSMSLNGDVRSHHWPFLIASFTSNIIFFAKCIQNLKYSYSYDIFKVILAIILPIYVF